MSFHDHFSEHAREYAAKRPDYPVELFGWLASMAPDRRLAWDAGTGNGQAAVGLAREFEKVVATDLSPQQLEAATEHERVEYRLAACENSGLAPGSAAVVTVAQALHWFNFEAFYAEVRRAAVPGAVIAAWCYELHSVSPEIDEVIRWFYREIVGPYWPSERRFIEEGYRTIPFPFRPLESPKFAMRADWNLAQLLGYLDTWSAVRRYAAAKRENPLEKLARPLAEAWGEAAQRRSVRWPLTMLAGRIE